MRNVVVFTSLLLVACGGEARTPPPPPPAMPVATPPETAEVPPETVMDPPADPGSAEPDEAQAGPLRARITADPADAEARCELAWLYFGVGNMAGAEAEATRAIATLEASQRVPDAAQRARLGACLATMGRVHEVRGELDRALARFETSLWYREDGSTRERWQETRTALGGEHATPVSPPASLWDLARQRERDVCELDDGDADLSLGADSTEGDCRVELVAYVRSGARMAAVLGTVSVDDGGTLDRVEDDTGSGRYGLATRQSGAWEMRDEDVFTTDLDFGASADVSASVRIRDVQPGGEPELVVDIEAAWSRSADEYGSGGEDGTDGEVIICGDPDGDDAFVCAHIPTVRERFVVSDEYDSDSQERCVVAFRAGGVVRIRGRMDGARVREETTVADLWSAELAARRPAPPQPVAAIPVAPGVVPVAAPTALGDRAVAARPVVAPPVVAPVAPRSATAALGEP